MSGSPHEATRAALALARQIAASQARALASGADVAQAMLACADTGPQRVFDALAVAGANAIIDAGLIGTLSLGLAREASRPFGEFFPSTDADEAPLPE
ncbi:hypothetical protein ABEG18_25000 [Alsobacter sp. KACC 23698]|uniref:Uncharacterized protein n=1 Tax=Alsobacter sp. KACC 23698 TaxID=3149229 RepID=A0AAU7JFG0_9HYPH